VRVLLVFDWFMKYAAEQAVGLHAAGADVQVICRDHLEEFGGSVAEWERCVARIASDTGRAPMVIQGRTTSINAVAHAAVTFRNARRWNPDVVHAHPNVDPWLLSQAQLAPLVMTIHDPVPHPGQPRHGIVRRGVADLWERRAAGFILHGEELREAFGQRARGRPTAVVHHGLAPSAIPNPVPDRPMILFFGRLEPYKGLAVLMQAMPILWEARPDAELVIAGRGPSEVELIDDPRIRKILRYVGEGEVDDLLREARLVVAPYTEGSQSGVVSLACARGVPAIVSAVGALPSLVVDGSQVVRPNDAQDLARSLLQHLDHSMTLRETIHEMAISRLSWRGAGEQTLRFYEDALGR